MAMRAAVSRWMNQKLAGALITWMTVVADAVHQRAQLKRAVMRMMHRSMAAALGTWRGVAAEMKEQQP